MRAWRALAISSAVVWSALATATPIRPHRWRTNPERANRQLALEPILDPSHASPDAGLCDFEFGACFWWIGSISTETSGIPNSGVRATMNAVNFQPDAGCFDCWTSENLDNSTWGQVGFSSCMYPSDSQLNFTVFYQAWNTDAGVLLVDGESTSITQGPHTFSMSLDAGTLWDYAVDGVIFGSHDMGSATASGPYAISTVCEEGDGVPAAFVPPSISIPSTMQVDNGGAWSAANSAYVYNTAGLSGVVGNLQDATLANDATVIGGASPYLTPYTTLWNGSGSGILVDGGAAPVMPAYINLSAPLPNATVSGTVQIVAEVSAPANSTVYFFASDPNGPECTLTAGPYVCNWDTTTDPDGGLVNVTAEVQDPAGYVTWSDLSVTVDNMGGTGGGTSGGTSGGAGGGTSGGDTSGGSTGGAGVGSSGSTGGRGSTSGGGGGTTGRASASSSGSSAGSSSGGGTPTTSGGGATTGASPPPKTASTGCGCAAGNGSPAAALPFFLLAFGVRRRRRRR